jgi:hypothetical protein
MRRFALLVFSNHLAVRELEAHDPAQAPAALSARGGAAGMRTSPAPDAPPSSLASRQPITERRVAP